VEKNRALSLESIVKAFEVERYDAFDKVVLELASKAPAKTRTESSRTSKSVCTHCEKIGHTAGSCFLLRPELKPAKKVAGAAHK
jgi:hypothetical protein